MEIIQILVIDFCFYATWTNFLQCSCVLLLLIRRQFHLSFIIECDLIPSICMPQFLTIWSTFLQMLFRWTFTVLICFHTILCSFPEWPHLGWSETFPVPWNFLDDFWNVTSWKFISYSSLACFFRTFQYVPLQKQYFHVGKKWKPKWPSGWKLLYGHLWGSPCIFLSHSVTLDMEMISIGSSTYFWVPNRKVDIFFFSYEIFWTPHKLI